MTSTTSLGEKALLLELSPVSAGFVGTGIEADVFRKSIDPAALAARDGALPVLPKTAVSYRAIVVG